MNISDDKRPWGSFRQFTKNELSTVKILTVKSGEAFSLQYHVHRDEFWKVLSGSPTISIGEKDVVAQDGDEFFIPRGTTHRITAGEKDAHTLEIASGDFDENDIVRLEDKYNRT
jgi:mannose-6-phosphate isomerase-like protein (cupin superfamily)